jgi:hypothetical protein
MRNPCKRASGRYKRRYASKAAAKAALAVSGGRKRFRVYRCDECWGYHASARRHFALRCFVFCPLCGWCDPNHRIDRPAICECLYRHIRGMLLAWKEERHGRAELRAMLDGDT